MSTNLSQTDLAVEKIRSSIIDLSLPPASRIDEPLLLKRFGLGRTPAREALNRLAAEGFVTIAPNRGGLFVRALDLPEMLEIVRAQQVVENMLGHLLEFDDDSLVADLRAIQAQYAIDIAARDYLAITSTNQAFHLRMHKTVRNGFVYSFAESTHRHVRRLNVQIYLLEAASPRDHNARLDSNLAEHEQIIEAIADRDRARLVSLLVAHARTALERLNQVLDHAVVPLLPLEDALTSPS
ncbi:DNA-binding GntR family transcriptional regulator [Microbacterium sp. BE35]|uniref:GntR family transcriptional regulator n=1 Tax=Microbacterium sp. BE35 TaxID=2817773 RepID=UPI00285FC9E6|nr:GntR family transcriptional regulator [Microbacterium sp. BE35]MDR7188245.1 DNA-binding GntR family transcriptional regulator [Microbacterium sp. BE35]